jgi:hypothetical protein
MGLSVRCVHRGDLVDVAASGRSDLLLVDEAASMPDSTLHMLLSEGDKRPATTTVLLCLPAFVRRLSTVADAVVVELTRLSQSDTRLYLQERATQAGFPNLFTPAGLDLIVDASRGLPRSLWSIAGLAYFYAASEGASQISRQNVPMRWPHKLRVPKYPRHRFHRAFRQACHRDVGQKPSSATCCGPPRASASVAVFRATTSV